MTKKRSLKGILTLMCLATIFLSGIFTVLNYSNTLADGNANPPYYRTELMKSEVLENYPGADIIYNALEQMDFASGENKILEGDIIQELAANYTQGGTKLLDAFGAAVGSFSFDHTEYFYVDFDRLSLNITTNSSGKYVVEIGAGRSDNYFVGDLKANNTNISELIQKYEAELAKAVAYVNENATSSSNYSYSYTRALYASKYLCNLVTYGFGTDTNGKENENAKWIATPYGALVNEECICE